MRVAMFFIGAILLAAFSANADICPMEHHHVCNSHHAKHKCVCALVVEENSAPEVSCNKVMDVDEDDGKFPAVSIQFNLDEDDEDIEEFPEGAFRNQIANSLRISRDSVMIARVSCQGTEDQLTVQFGVLKKDVNASMIPYKVEHFIDADNLATRMKAMGHLNKIADLDVESIEFVEELVDIEYDPDNSVLIMQAIGVSALFGLLFVLGCCFLFKKKDEPEYNGDLQKA